MKNLIIKAAAAAMLIFAWAEMTASAQDNELVKKALEDKSLTIEVNSIHPSGHATIISSDGYKLRIEDGKVNARLPYFGRSDVALISGVDETGIAFEDCAIDIKEDYSKSKKGKYSWKFSALSGSENIDVTITFWDNGGAEISCICARRSPISYSGELISYTSPDGQ